VFDVQLANSPVELVNINGDDVYIKRDDLLHLEFSGNKARKFYYYLKDDAQHITHLISYGSPQANSFYSLSALAKLKGWRFDFYVDHISDLLRQNPQGNYRAGIDNGANIIELSTLKDSDQNIENYLNENKRTRLKPNELFVEEGGRGAEAAVGVEILAQEIERWRSENSHASLIVALPSGTGTTALFLQRYFVQHTLPITVVTCACVGGNDYLTQQWLSLDANTKYHPQILSSDKKYHFGKLYDEFYSMWKYLKQETHLEFELLYDPLGWITLLDYIKQKSQQKSPSSPIMYIHQGGLKGNESMLPRYIRREDNRIKKQQTQKNKTLKEERKKGNK
jgi:1-aminocyclopropane-1-carboxylate deaminase